MSSLRWILLAGGAALVLTLLVVGLMRGRQAARASEKRELRPAEDPALGELPEVGEHELAQGLPAANPVVGASAPGTLNVGAVGASVEQEPADAESGRPSIAEWPPADQRIICSLRVVPSNQERLSGRRVRQGLQSAGFVHGDLAIFHLPGRPDRAMLSAANLAQPGQLDPALMDYQRFPGLHVFTVLPGRLPAAMALQQLYAVTAEIARRVDGRVQDDTGRPLDPLRVDAWLQRHTQQAAAVPGVTTAAAAG
jgi:FtsZ-interacting cell division protein ZipA